MKRQFSTALALSLVAAIHLGAADLYVASGASETASCASIAEACDFQTALDKARTNTEADTIHVASGTYNIFSGLTYKNSNEGDDDSALTIQRWGTEPAILNGGSPFVPIMTINGSYMSGDSDVDFAIKGITFSNGLGDRDYAAGLSMDTYLADISIEDSTFIGNTYTGQLGGGGGLGIFAEDGNITLTNNTFRGNSTDGGGGGANVISLGSGNITLTNNIFSGNIRGGGSHIQSSDGNVTLVNNIFSGNFANNSGGGASLSLFNGNATLTNNTFSGNSAWLRGGGVNIYFSSDLAKVELYNNIIWNNTANEGENDGDDLFVRNTGNIVKLYNNNLGSLADFDSGQSADLYVTNTDNYIQASNLKEDPLFVDADNGDFHLTESSPLIDMGDLNAPALPATDFEGDNRIIDGNGDDIAIPDIGADEYNPPVKQADDIIEFIESGNLEATGPGKSADKQMNALANKIEAAKQLIEDGDIDGACDQLESTLLLTDGDTTPPDWVAGDTAVDLANMIQNLMDSIGCPVQ